MLFLLSVALVGLGAQGSSDPDNLSIGRSGTTTIQPGQLVDMRSGQPSTLAKLADAAGGKPFVFLGENHATTAHQLEEAAVISQLVTAGRKVSVGLEMFTRPKQDVLDQWSTGKLSESDFLVQSDWKGQWGYDYGYYRPVLEAVRTNQLPLIALNVPRAWVHTVATAGFGYLPTSARIQLPKELFLANKEHREVFDSMMGGHATGNSGMDGMYAAQVLWDEGMADTAIKYRDLKAPADSDVFVVIAGAGHVMYGQGINYRIRHRHEGDGITVVMISSGTPVKVANGIADFVYVSAPEAKS